MKRFHRNILGGSIRAVQMEEYPYPSYLGLRAPASLKTFYNGSTNVPQPGVDFSYPTIGEIGEFSSGEVRSLIEFNIQEYKTLLDNDILNNTNILGGIKFYFIFKLNSYTGAGHIGATPNGYTSSSPYIGNITLLKYSNPNIASSFTNIAITNNLAIGDEIKLDITNLVKTYINPPNAFTSVVTYFGIMLRPNLFDIGSCGPANGAIRPNCSGVIFDNFNMSIEDPINYPVNITSTVVKLRNSPNQNIRIINI